VNIGTYDELCDIDFIGDTMHICVWIRWCILYVSVTILTNVSEIWLYER